jgi:alpha-beta hydrolase superfamily lysophospholipase
MDRAPHLSFAGDEARAEAVVLLLHGGETDSFASVPAFNHAVLRLVPFGRSVLRAGRGRIALAKLRYSVRGWNGELDSPLADARWALDQIVLRFGSLPIGLVGHSMGGRVALRVVDHLAEDEQASAAIRSGPIRSGPIRSAGIHSAGIHGGGVRSVAALAPWIPKGEPIPLLGDRALLLAHGTADRVTNPSMTLELAQKLVANGADVELKMYPGGRHDMLFPARPWHDLVAGFMVRTLLGPSPEPATGPGRK